jgi:hypothetical protein
MQREGFGHGHVVKEAGDIGQEAKFGRNIHTVIEMSRHEEPGKITEGPKAGMSADFLTEKGQQRSADKGSGIKEGFVKDYSSPKLRAQQTGDLGLQAVDANANGVFIINQKLENFKGVVKGQKPGSEFIMRIRSELDTTKNFDLINAEAKPWVAEQLSQGSKMTAYDLTVQYYLDHQDRCAELGTTTPQEAATEVAYTIIQEIDMSQHFKNDSDVRLRNFTHGPKLEPFLQRAVAKKNHGLGFKSVDEIGGAVKPGESFLVPADRDSQGNLSVKLTFRGQDYSLDEQTVREMAKEYIKGKNLEAAID